MNKEVYDFSGWATKANLKCSDGRTIMRDAFKHNDGEEVPLVWNHQHNSPEEVLGKALLENRDEGVYAYCSFNDTEHGKTAKLLVQHGDVRSLSIYANQLKESMNNVIHGNIREVSLVLAGANPGAYIDYIMAHSDNGDEESTDEAMIYNDGDIGEELEHSDNSAYKAFTNEDGTVNVEKVQEVLYTFNDEQVKALAIVSDYAANGAKTGEDFDVDEVRDVLKTLSNEQMAAFNMSVGAYVQDNVEKDGTDDEDEEDEEDKKNQNGENVSHSDTQNNREDDSDMKKNVFENGGSENGSTLSHSDLENIVKDIKRYGSVKESFLAHASDYGIDNVDMLFPDYKEAGPAAPEFIKYDDEWVKTVMGAVHHTPFSRVKTTFADITEDQARAKGYIKGNLKKEEVFSLLRRVTSPTMIYKKQKMDKQDLNSITWDVIPWLKAEMRMMLNEELARAILIGDGRLSSDEDKINEQNIRPILTDADLFVIRWGVANGADAAAKAKNFITACIKARKNYKGSGNPTLFTTEDMLTEMLLLEDTQGHTLYKTEQELATKLRVRNIVTVPYMENLEVDVSGNLKDVHGIIVNLADYNIGADKGGQVSMFEDFDIDYNQEKYLIETECSGALVKPFSAIVLREADTTASLEPTIAQATAPYKA